MKYLYFFLATYVILSSCQPQDRVTTGTTFDPFALAPGDTARLFFPGYVSQGLYERDMAITSDYDELFFGVLTGKHNTIMHMKRVDGKWQGPEIAPFATDPMFFYLEPAFSPDDKRLYFLSTCPMEGEDTLSGWANQNIWYVEKQENGEWGEMKALDSIINTSGGEFYPSIADNGNLYYTWNEEGSRKSYVRKAEWNGKNFEEPEFLPENVCGDGQIFNASIAPDESYLVACATGRDDMSRQQPRYYVFFNLGEGKWTDAIYLGDRINLPGSQAISCSISRDGKYLFFASSFTPENEDPQKPLTAEDMYGHYTHPQNGLMDIYWISSDVIRELKP